MVLVGKEEKAWDDLRLIAKNFLGIRGLKTIQNLMIICYYHSKNRLQHALKKTLLYSHLDFFPYNHRVLSDKRGERFREDIENMEKRYQEH